ncbi:DUF4202 domain-containing protein [Marinimicrobium sp. ABcell2]|uniref:DUF4202 domain-containing protein n=1 Tax=Marinimicrobium sp. ABcell2 TaxID=3069751 RepID=UPI0027B03B56|nr:DUF4202 domain-containing protein [Marinimicrobium sp. ABcell2]MDQ2075208.1 DUF4202 domain-containing protein [Marinimicrobium sp. ABcell2]
MPTSPQLLNTLAAFDTTNQEDPNTDFVNGIAVAKEYLYGVRMSECLQDFCPDASETLQLAARAQHIRRWDIPRADFPMDRAGYKKWRTRLGVYHGEVAGTIMDRFGYTPEEIERVQTLLSKRNLKRDPEVQTLEDVICLVFLRYYLEDFAKKHDEDKLIDIIRKTWRKMSPEGHTAALALPLSEAMKALVGKALQK